MDQAQGRVRQFKAVVIHNRASLAPTCSSQPNSWVVLPSGDYPCHAMGSLLLVIQLAVSQPMDKRLGRV